MIQELLGGNSGVTVVGGGGGERNKMNYIGSSNNGGILEGTTTSTVVVPNHHSSKLLISSSSSSNSSSVVSGSTSVADNKNNNQLRCPRCDSANTKFCYYNNYNLTQPRHFCKTCRRYWTKGGALRNVPIGGGCRRNKPAVAKPKTPPPDIPAAGARFAVLDHFSQTQTPSPVLWGSPQSSHLLSLLGSANPSPNPNPNSTDSLSVKEEGSFVGGSAESAAAASHLGRSLGLDGLWRPSSLMNKLQPTTPPAPPPPPHAVQYGHQVGFTVNEGHRHRSDGDSGIQELYRRLRLSSSPGNYSFYNNDQTAVVLTHHVGSMSSTPSSHMESALVNGGGGEFGFWNNSSPFSWSDLQPSTATTTNSAYP